MSGITVTGAVEDELNPHRLFVKIFLSNSLSAILYPTPVYIYGVHMQSLLVQFKPHSCQKPKRNELRRRRYIPKITSQIPFINGLSTAS